MNIENCRTWLSYLRKALAEEPAATCNMRSGESTCKSPGCVVGWTYQLMEPLIRPYTRVAQDIAVPYCFSQHSFALRTYLGIGDEHYDNNLPSISDDWSRFFEQQSSDFFSSAEAYGVTNRRPIEMVTLGTVINRWERFVSHMEAKLAV